MRYFLIRKTIHFLFGITAIILIYRLPELSAYLFTAAAVLFFILDLWRRVEGQWRKDFYLIFDKLLKPAERSERITGATTFIMAVAGLTFSFPTEIVVVSILILSISDPLASVTGKVYPIKEIWKEKSLTGSSMFFLSATVIYLFFAPASAIPVLLAALFVTLIELFAPDILENILVGFGAGILFVLISS